MKVTTIVDIVLVSVLVGIGGKLVYDEVQKRSGPSEEVLNRYVVILGYSSTLGRAKACGADIESRTKIMKNWLIANAPPGYEKTEEELKAFDAGIRHFEKEQNSDKRIMDCNEARETFQSARLPRSGTS